MATQTYGSYKGVPITSGNQAAVNGQVAAITGAQAPAANATFPQFPQTVPTYGAPVTDTMGRTGTAAFDPNTGKALTPPPATAPTATTPPAATAGDQYLQSYLESLKPSQAEQDYQKQLDALTSKEAGINASKDLGIQGVGEQPIATPFITGQQAAITNRAATQVGALSAEAVPLQQQLSRAQALRQSSMDVTKALLEANKPVSLAYGAQLTNPLTGATVNPGLFGGSTGGSGVNPVTGLNPTATSADILGYLAQNGVQTTRYNIAGLVNAVQNGATAQDIISGKVNVASQTAAGTSGATYKQGAIPGTYVQPNASGINTSLGSTGSGTTLASGASGTTVQALQQFLVSKGYMTQAQMNTGPGTYGPATTAAVAAFQKAAGVDTSGGGVGSFGPRTLSAAQAQGYGGGATGATSSASSGTSSGGSQYANAATIRANATALTDQTKYLNTVQRAFNTAQANLNAIIPFMQQAGVNSGSTVPLINSLQNAVKSHLTDAGTIAGFQAALSGLRAEYAQVLSRGGDVTDASRSQALSLIPDNLTPAQLQQVAARLNTEGTNAVSEAQSQVQSIQGSLGGKTSTQAGAGTSDYQSYLKAIGQ